MKKILFILSLTFTLGLFVPAAQADDTAPAPSKTEKTDKAEAKSTHHKKHKKNKKNKKSHTEQQSAKVDTTKAAGQ